MRVFPHGNVVNFQASVREMFSADLERLLNRAIEGTSVLTGTIDADQGELRLYGRIRDVEIDEQGDRFAIRFRDMENQADREAVRSFEQLSISHEAHFDIEDPDRGTVRYSVYYVTFTGEDGEEETFFFAGENSASRPLDCVAAFWDQVRNVGRDTDFSSSGCASKFRPAGKR
ncbi:hypothetical protein [Planifilum fimeticola]|jgi:hypothetical protein